MGDSFDGFPPFLCGGVIGGFRGVLAQLKDFHTLLINQECNQWLLITSVTALGVEREYGCGSKKGTQNESQANGKKGLYSAVPGSMLTHTHMSTLVRPWPAFLSGPWPNCYVTLWHGNSRFHMALWRPNVSTPPKNK